MKIIPIQDIYNQTFSVILAKQNCQISLYQKETGLYCDLYIDDTLIIGGIICQNLNKIVRDSHLGFTGDLIFSDTQDVLDPSSPGLGTRYLFIYMEATDL